MIRESKNVFDDMYKLLLLKLLQWQVHIYSYVVDEREEWQTKWK